MVTDDAPDKTPNTEIALSALSSFRLDSTGKPAILGRSDGLDLGQQVRSKILNFSTPYPVRSGASPQTPEIF